jgi:hypothetical protein
MWDALGLLGRRVIGEPSLKGAEDFLEPPFVGNKANAACRWRDALV